MHLIKNDRDIFFSEKTPQKIWLTVIFEDGEAMSVLELCWIGSTLSVLDIRFGPTSHDAPFTLAT